MLIKLALGEETINIISAYNPQIKLKESIKHKFLGGHGWIDSRVTEWGKYFYWRIPECSWREKIVGGFKGVYLGLRYGVWNEPGDYILNFALEYDLILMNT